MSDNLVKKNLIKKKVLLLLTEGFELMEASGFTDVMAWASFREDVELELVSASIRSPIKTAFGGLTVSPQAQLSELNLEEFDALAIPGGMEGANFYDDAYSEEFSEAIRYFSTAGKPIAAVCVASLSLGHAGILKGKKASVYHSQNGTRRAVLEQQSAIFVDYPIVRDGNITTSTGPGTSVEVALALLGDLVGAEIVTTTRELMRVPTPEVQWYTAQVPNP